MQNNDKKYFIPVDGAPIEVSEEIYRAYYQPIWNTRYHAQKNGECRCTKAQLWKCDGVCPGCPFYAAGKKVSIDTPIGGEEDELTLGDTLADDASSAESILMDKELLDALYDELNRLDPDGRRICELIMQGKTEREIAADMGKRQSTMPNKMSVDRDENGQLYYTYYRGSDEAIKDKGSSVTLYPSDVLHIPGLGFDGLVGYSPIAMAKNAIGMAIACEEYGAKFFANGAAPGGVLEHPGTIKDPQRVRESWQSTFGGSGNANKIAVLEEGMKYTPIGISPEQAQFLETRKFQINEIARIFRVPPHMVGDLEKSSFSNIEQQSLEFVKYTLDPWVIRWEQSIQRSLLSRDEKAAYFVKFNLEGLLRGDYQSRMNGYAIGRQNGWMSANDIRELENLDRIPEEDGGDLYLINGNMLPLKNAGAFADTPTDDGKEEKTDEEILELEEPNGDELGDAGADTGKNPVPERDHRRGKLV